jgi:ParB family transcriptional regulator, chromosome partitioning protein
VTRRSGLGRGLGALIPTEAIDAGDGSGVSLREIPVASVCVNPRQPRERFDEEALASLTDSVRELGVLQPILVRQVGTAEYELIAGERRWRAARRAGLASIPAVVRTVDDRRSLEEALVENLHRQDLNPLEEAAAYQQLVDEHGLTQDEVAQRVGKSRPAVANAIRLFQLPGAVQRLVARGDLSAGHARALLAAPDSDVQERLAARVVAEGLTVRQVEELVRPRLPVEPGPEPSSPAPASGVAGPRPAAVLELEEVLGDRLDTRVQVAVGRGRGRVTIEFADLADLDRIYRILVGGDGRSVGPQDVDNNGDNG